MLLPPFISRLLFRHYHLSFCFPPSAQNFTKLLLSSIMTSATGSQTSRRPPWVDVPEHERQPLFRISTSAKTDHSVSAKGKWRLVYQVPPDGQRGKDIILGVYRLTGDRDQDDPKLTRYRWSDGQAPPCRKFKDYDRHNDFVVVLECGYVAGVFSTRSDQIAHSRQRRPSQFQTWLAGKDLRL